MADDVTERITILLDLQKDAHDRGMRASAREVANLEKAYDPLSRATIRHKTEQEKLNKALEKGTLDAARHAELMEKVQVEYDQTTAKIIKQNAVLAANANVGGGVVGMLNRNKNAVQQLGYQVGDFAVQVGNGMSAFTAFAQQGSQVLGVLGPFGAIAGAAVAIGAPLAAAFFAAGDEAKDAGKALEKLSEAVGDFRAAADLATASGDDLNEMFGAQSEAIQDTLELLAKLERIKAFDRVKAAAAEAGESIADIRDMVEDIANGRELLGGGRFALFKTDFQELSEQIGLTLGQMQQLVAAVGKLGSAQGPQQTIDAARAINELLLSIYGTVEDIPPQLRVLAEEAAKVEVEASKVLDASLDLIDVWRDLPETAKTFADELARALGFAEGLQGITLDGILGGVGLPTSGQWLSRAEGMQSATDLIREKEGLRAKAYWDVNHWRVGYGSDTTTDANGNFSKVTQGTQVTIAKAERDLQRRIGEYFNAIIEQIGIDRFDAMPAAQQGALASLLHNYGAGDFKPGGDLGKVLEAIIARNDELVAQRIVELGAGGHEGTPTGEGLKARRREEARAFGSADATIRAQSDADKAAADAARDKAKADSEATQASEKRKSAIEAMLAPTDAIAKAEKEYADAIALVQEALAAGDIDPETAAAARAALAQDLQDTIAKVNEQAAQAKNPFEQMQKNVESLTESLLRTAAAGGDVGEALRNFLLDATIKAAAQDLSKVLMSMFGGGSGGGLLSSIAGFLFGGANANGNAFSGGRVVPFADGGVVGGPTLFGMSGGRTGLMGEAGPEAIMPLTRIGGKLGVRAAGGGSTMVNQSFTIDARGAQEGVADQIKRAMQQIQREVPGIAVQAVYAANRESPLT